SMTFARTPLMQQQTSIDPNNSSNVLINPSMTFARTPLTQQQTSIDPNNFSNVFTNPSMTFARTPLTQQQTSIEPNNSSNVQVRYETESSVVNQQPSDSHERDFSQIMNTNLFSDSNTQRSEGQHTFRLPDQAQDRESSDN